MRENKWVRHVRRVFFFFFLFCSIFVLVHLGPPGRSAIPGQPLVGRQAFLSTWMQKSENSDCEFRT